MCIAEVVRPSAPELANIKSMQVLVRQAQQRVKAERIRQQQLKLNRQCNTLAGM